MDDAARAGWEVEDGYGDAPYGCGERALNTGLGGCGVGREG